MSGTGARGSGWGSPSASAWRTNSAGPSASPAPATREAASKSSSETSVLVVEDDRTARRALALLLRHRGFVVSEAGTIAEAVAGLAAGLDWVLLDLMLPDGCGFEVYRRAAAD